MAPGRGQLWPAFELITLDPQGSAYYELVVPEDPSPAYVVDIDGSLQIAGTVLGFSEYPTPCVEQSFDGGGEIEILLPQECTSLTVILSNTGGSEASSEVVLVSVRAATVTDSFERTRAQGWGVPDAARRWRDRDGTAVNGSVSGGSGRLEYGGRSAYMPPNFDWFVGVVLVARFSDCEVNQSVNVDLGSGTGAVRLSTTGQLSSPGDSVALDGLDPCEPWYLRIGGDGDGAAAKVWQATESEPDDWQLHWSAEGSAAGVRIRTSGASAPGEHFIIDALDTEQGYGG